MSPEFVQIYGPIASCVAALAALGGATFAFLNWARSRSQDKPRVRLDRPKPIAGLVDSKIHIENRGQKDILVTGIDLLCGTFAGTGEYDVVGGTAGYVKTAETRRDAPLLVPSGLTVSDHMLFHADAPLVHVSLARRHKDYVVVISASRR